MDIDIKNSQNQDMNTLIHSLELTSARVFESVLTLSQTACSSTPEMQALFQEWIACIGEEFVNEVNKTGKIVPEEVAKTIGVSPATIISLALTLHRQGRINIKSLEAEVTDSTNQECCGCLKS